MRISSRRLLWGFSCLLFLAVCMIFRPVRSWIDQTLLARAIHPGLTVQEIHLHPNKIEAGLSIVEAKQFDWSATQGNRSFGITAERAWMVLENESLVDKKLTIPRALLQQSKLYLETIPEVQSIAANTSANSGNQGSLWQQQLNSRFGELEWNDLRQHFDGVLKLNSFTNQCGSKIDSWVANCEKITSEARSLGSGSERLDNPLRGDADLHDRIAKIEQLIARENTERTDLTNVDALVQAKLKEIGQQFDKHVGIVKEKAQQNKHNAKQQIAKQLLEQTGGRILSQFKSYAEIADLLCRAFTRKNGFSADEDYRTSGCEVLNLDNLAATGVFAVEDTKSPFRMQSQCVLTAKEPFGNIARSNFRYQFDAHPFTIKLVASSRLEQPEVVDLQVEILPLEQPAIDLIAQTQADVTIGSAQWVIGSSGTSIAGELSINHLLLPFLADGNPAIISAISKQLTVAESKGESIPDIVLEIGGTWASPTWKTDGSEIPQWLEAIIDAHLDQQLRNNEHHMIAKLEEHVAVEADRLSKQLGQKLEVAQKQTRNCSQNLASIQMALKNKLSGDSNTEFARSGQDEVKR